MSSLSVANRRIHFAPEQIPEVTEPMAIFTLGAPVRASEDTLSTMIRAVAPEVELADHGSCGLRAAFAGKRLVAYVHPDTGESAVYPALESLKPGNELARRAQEAAERTMGDQALFPEDHSELTALAPVTLFGARHTKGGPATRPAEFMSFVRFERRVDGLPVFGPGSKAMIGVAADGSTHAFSHRWRPAHRSAETLAPRPREAIARAILDQLLPSAGSDHVKVGRVSVGYYDAGHELLQPVYRFEATVVSPDGDDAADRNILGYVSVGEAPESLPVLGIEPENRPAEPPARGERPLTGHAAGGSDPTVGRYVVRDDSPDWVSSANSFMANLESAQALFGGIQFTDSQYYWAEPFEFTSDKNAYVNSVQIALNEVHGNWGLFSTEKNDADFVYLKGVPAGGYGSGGGGSLAYWILHSCEVIPTQTDESTSFGVWWNLFDGLHAAVGYRTEMWIADGVTGPFGFAIGLGAPVISAWINEVVSNSSYNPDATYLDGDRNITEPMGRPSAVAVCGHSDDTAADVEPLPAATCLTEWWINN